MIKVEFKKYMLSGIAEGCTITEKMSFVTWDKACEWAGNVTMKIGVPYVILEMRNLATGEVENF